MSGGDCVAWFALGSLWGAMLAAIALNRYMRRTHEKAMRAYESAIRLVREDDPHDTEGCGDPHCLYCGKHSFAESGL